MPSRRYVRKPFVLDAAGAEGGEAARVDGLADEVASGLGGLTIVLAPDDSSWLKISGKTQGSREKRMGNLLFIAFH